MFFYRWARICYSDFYSHTQLGIRIRRGSAKNLRNSAPVLKLWERGSEQAWKSSLCLTQQPTYIIAIFQEIFKWWLHVMMVHSHKEGIHNDADGDEQFHKRIEYDEWTELLYINPACTAVPNAADIYTLHTLRQAFLFEFGFLLLLLILSVCWKIIDGHWIMFKYDRLVACGRGLSTLCWHTTHTTNYDCHAQDKGARLQEKTSLRSLATTVSLIIKMH